MNILPKKDFPQILVLSIEQSEVLLGSTSWNDILPYSITESFLIGDFIIKCLTRYKGT